MGMLLAKDPNGFGAKKMYEISIPATHNSATYNIKPDIISSIAKCQQYDVLHQLRSGVRLVDFRISDDAPGGVVRISHQFLCGSLDDNFQQIKKFLVENKNEVLVVAIKKDWDRKLSQEGSSAMIQMALNYFAEYLMTREDLENLSVSELIRRNKRIHFSSPGLGESPLFASQVAQTWSVTNTPYSDVLIRNLTAYKFEDGLRQIKIYDCYLTPSPESIAFWSVSGKNWHKLQRDANTQVLSWLKSARGKVPFNAVSTDMVDQGIVDLVIDFNSDR